MKNSLTLPRLIFPKNLHNPDNLLIFPNYILLSVMIFTKKAIIAALIVLCGFSLMAQNTNIDKVVAVVGDNIILQSEIEVQYLQLKNQGQNTNYTPRPDEKCHILDQLLLEKLFIAQAKADSLFASDEEIDAELDRRVRYFTQMFGTVEKMEEYYGKTLAEMKDDFREDVSSQLLAEKMKGKIFTGMKVSPAEVRTFFDKIPKDSIPYFNSEVELGEVVMLPKISEEAKEMAREKLEKIRKDIVGGSDFSLQALLYSEDPGSATDGGNLGIIARGELVPEFEAEAFRLKENELSDIVETIYGFHIILVDEIRGSKRKIRHILIKPKMTSADSRVVKATLDSVLQQLRTDSMSFREAVAKFSDDENTKSVGGLMTNPKTGNSFFEKADIDGSLIFTIDKMKVGEYSDVMSYQSQDKSGDTRSGYRIIYLKSETKPHKASLETDYSKIAAAAKQQKQREEMDRWIGLYKDKTYIKIAPEYHNCEPIQKWLKPEQN